MWLYDETVLWSFNIFLLMIILHFSSCVVTPSSFLIREVFFVPGATWKKRIWPLKDFNERVLTCVDAEAGIVIQTTAGQPGLTCSVEPTSI